jgi:hypothetical protein
MITPDWVTHGGQQIQLSRMTSAHIRAVIRYLQVGDGEHGPMLRAGCSGFSNFEWILLCKCELTRRARLGLC